MWIFFFVWWFMLVPWCFSACHHVMADYAFNSVHLLFRSNLHDVLKSIDLENPSPRPEIPGFDEVGEMRNSGIQHDLPLPIDPSYNFTHKKTPNVRICIWICLKKADWAKQLCNLPFTKATASTEASFQKSIGTSYCNLATVRASQLSFKAKPNKSCTNNITSQINQKQNTYIQTRKQIRSRKCIDIYVPALHAYKYR